MAYTQEADIRLWFNTNRVTEAGDDDRDGSADTGVIAAAIAWGDARLYGLIANRYALDPDNLTPATTPDALRYYAAQLAGAKVFQRQLRGGLAKELQDEALAWGAAVREGFEDIPESTAVDLADGPHLNRLRLFREKGIARDIGEPEGQNVSGDNDNFYVGDEW